MPKAPETYTSPPPGDLPNRLRAYVHRVGATDRVMLDLCVDAANEIERLRNLLLWYEDGPHWRHKARGTDYQEIGRGPLQASTRPLVEGDMVVSYKAANGDLYFRGADEFGDGRFEEIKRG